jgi:hypothetical protein
MKQIVFSIFWGIGLYFASAMVIGAMSGILFFCLAIAGIDSNTNPRFFSIYGISISIAIWGIGIMGFIFGLLGKLPGTRQC